MSRLFPINIHPVERGVRVVAGLVLLGCAFTGSIGAWGYIGVIPLATGLFGTCPLYTIFGFSTCPSKAPKAG